MGVFVDYALASKAANTMETAIDGVRTTLKQINDAVDIAQKGWQGTAATAFQSAAAEWDQDQEKLNLKLNVVHAAVETGQKNFDLMDSDNSNDFNLESGTPSGYSHLKV